LNRSVIKTFLSTNILHKLVILHSEDGLKLKIDPWSSTQYEDYLRLREEFGIGEFNFPDLPNAHKLFRRGVIFGHRGFDLIMDAIKNNKPWCILTGLAPSGKMHIGHKMVIDQVIYYQSIGAEIFLAVADIEALGVRNVSLEQGRKIAIEEYITNYIALGLKPENCQIYFQSSREEVKDLAYLTGNNVNLSEMRAIYGFDDSTNMTHVYAPLVQVGDILHVQLEKYGGPKPTLVPVGVDQDPHLRLTRNLAFSFRIFNVTVTKDNKIGIFVKPDDNVESLLDEAEKVVKDMGFADYRKIPSYKALYLDAATNDDILRLDEALIPIEQKFGGYGFYLPASTYHQFMSGLTGGKMSSSEPESSIFLSDTPEVGVNKVKCAITGGAVTKEEHMKNGGKPDECHVFELFLYHFLEDDKELDRIYNDCKGGTQFCGQCKKLAGELVSKFLIDLTKKREEAKKNLDKYIRYD
jgi:tryptophanyl-tRNA synthetase